MEWTPKPYWNRKRCCVQCFSDADLKDFISEHGELDNCHFCNLKNVESIELNDLAQFIEQRLSTFYSRAIEEMPYEQEDGYLDKPTDTWDLLFYEVGLDVPDKTLAAALVDCVGDDAWCELEWSEPSLDDYLKSKWQEFSKIVKYHRRFFFHQLGGDKKRDSRESNFLDFLNELMHLVEQLGLFRTIPKKSIFYRGRGRKPGTKHSDVSQIGSPTPNKALSHSRMNPLGIPMFYCSDNEELVKAELKEPLVSIGKFESLEPLRVLNLVNLPQVPGFFSSTSLQERLRLMFLHVFTELITLPIDHDKRTVLEYIPTQVFTEFLRDFPFESGHLNGLMYPSATKASGSNFVLFLTQNELVNETDSLLERNNKDPVLELLSVEHLEIFET